MGLDFKFQESWHQESDLGVEFTVCPEPPHWGDTSAVAQGRKARTVSLGATWRLTSESCNRNRGPAARASDKRTRLKLGVRKKLQSRPEGVCRLSEDNIKEREGRPPACPGTTCPTPISVEHADIRVKNYSVNSRERYVCNSGFKRKAGTSTLTECVINKNTNTAHWTTPNLKCIRDPSLAHQSPVLPSTVVTPKVTPQPESPSPPEKEPDAVSPKSSDTTLTTQTAIVPGSGLTPSQPASAGTTGTGSHESSRAPSLATTTTLEPTASPSLGIPEISPNTSKVTKVAVSTSVLVLLVGAGLVVFLARYIRSRQASQPRDVAMETMESVPMTGDEQQ
ncbi:interleukin-15 receptor subunit alpha [Microtus oregoni]|uniref:interleukin-15 receptor subunit alpha n=1 Tax=Microtus oregoni TaxID=111838 RepID=UPI001BB2A874|nr:interleukin-15 receptor subunit alpha [Microtus oregoni]